MNKLTAILLFAILTFSCETSNTTNESTSDPVEALEVQEAPEVTETAEVDNTPRVTGIGGIFFQAEDPAAVKQWYGDNLGLAIDDYGSPFEFRNANRPDEINYLRWSAFTEESEYFEPSQKDFMINYRVHDIEALVEQLKANGVPILDDMTTVDYGKFIHIMGPEGTKIELWEPVDEVLTQMGGETTK